MKRQGDLLIIKVKEIPRDAVKKNNLILAEGEATGHLHELNLGEVYEKDGVLYFRAPEDKITTLNHPEHKAVSFEPGTYKVVRQREYAPRSWKKDWRHVSD
jgi:hypothetical protein